MALPNLTREQARIRAELLYVHNYHISLDLTDGSGQPGHETFLSTSVINFDARQGATSFIDIAAESIHSVTLNGQPVPIEDYEESRGIVLADLAEHNVVKVVAQCRYSNTGEGLHRFVDPVDGNVYVYSQFETADAKRMFACFDQPDLKASFQLEVTAPTEWVVVSNSRLISRCGMTTVFAPTPRLSTYLVALIAGPYAAWYDHYDDEYGHIPLGVFCRASLAAYMDAERIFTETKQGFQFYHQHFATRYPFGKYDQLFVPEFNAGAMENAGAVTFLEDYVFRSKVTTSAYERRAETILHEMAHMWFGDLVTMRWWDDLWLNESFATFVSVLCQSQATQYTQAWTTFANGEKAWAYQQDQLPSTHPIAADIPDLAAVEVNFDGITYAKGAAVLKQLVAYVGLDHFLAGLRHYFQAHAFANATFDDLLASLEQASGRDLSSWAQQWLKTTGLNTLRAEFSCDPQGCFTQFRLHQSGATPGKGETRTHRIAIGIYDQDSAGKLVRVHRYETDITGPVSTLEELIGIHRGQLILLNDDDLTYCSIELDPDSLQVAKRRLSDLEQSLPRGLVWSALWQMTRHARLAAREFIEIVCTHLGHEPDIGLVNRLARQTHLALDEYADPSWAKNTGWELWASTLLTLAQQASPGSDHQLGFINAFCECVLTMSQAEILAKLLTDDAEAIGCAGLIVDADLRWKIIGALARSGLIGAEDTSMEFLDEELGRDPSAAGQRAAEYASAARPQIHVKQQAWERVISDDSLANITGRAIIAGITQPGQHRLLSRFTQRYFAEIRSVWDRRSSEVAQSVVVGLYPHWDISQTALERADEFLSDPDLAPPLRRLILEGRDQVQRALRAQAYDRDYGMTHTS